MNSNFIQNTKGEDDDMIFDMQMIMNFSFKVWGFLFKRWSPNGD